MRVVLNMLCMLCHAKHGVTTVLVLTPEIIRGIQNSACTQADLFPALIAVLVEDTHRRCPDQNRPSNAAAGRARRGPKKMLLSRKRQQRSKSSDQCAGRPGH